MLCKVCCSALHKLNLARISCGLWVSTDALGMMTFEPRNLTSIAQLPKLICREWSFSRLAVSRSFGFLPPRLSYCSLSISLYTESNCISTPSTS